MTHPSSISTTIHVQLVSVIHTSPNGCITVFLSPLQLLGWLEEKLPSAGKLPAELQSMTPPLFSCLEDRSAEVRKKAQAVLPHLMAHLSYELMLKQCGKLKVPTENAHTCTYL